MTILASFVKWVIIHKTLKSCPEHGEISINYYDYYSLLSFTSRGSNMFSKVLHLWRWIELGSKACLCLCLAAQLLARCLILNAQISHQYSRATDICSIFLKCIKWRHLGSWSMIDAPCMVAVTTSSPGSWFMIDALCMVAVVTSSPSRCLQTFLQCLRSERKWNLARYEDKLSSEYRRAGVFEFPTLKGDIKFGVAQEDAWCLFGGCSHRAGGGSTGSSGFITRKVKPIATLSNGRGYSNATLFIYWIGIWQKYTQQSTSAGMVFYQQIN